MAGLPPPPRAVFLGGPGLRYREQAPPAALRPWVAAIWTVEAAAATTLRVLPDGCMDLIGGRVVGPMVRAVEVPLPAGRGGGIRLRPGAFPTLFGHAAADLLDADVALGELGRGLDRGRRRPRRRRPGGGRGRSARARAGDQAVGPGRRLRPRPQRDPRRSG